LHASSIESNINISLPAMMASEIGIRDVDPVMTKFLADGETYLLV
jgi:hypothetical protein